MDSSESFLHVNSSSLSPSFINNKLITVDPTDQAHPSLPLTESIPLIVLVIEAVCGVFCNGSVLLLFCVRSSLLRTASDMFTINLSIVDLAFSSIVLPIVAITSIKSKSLCVASSEPTEPIELARNCVVLFGTIATALGTLLVSLDRGDVSLKPSKRFFTHKKALTAIILTWSIATVGIIIVILPYIWPTQKESRDDEINGRKGKITYIFRPAVNNTEITYLKRDFTKDCCRTFPCNNTDANSCVYQLIFEIPVFFAAIMTIIVIYGKILWSVQRRSKRYIHGQHRSNFNGNFSKSRIPMFSNLRWCDADCCHQRKSEVNTQVMNNYRSIVTNNQEGNNVNESTVLKSKSTRRYITTTISNKKTKKQDSLEDALFVPSTSKKPNTVTNEGPSVKEKTDFATVAMSITVVLAIKRMAARKIKERKKKMRHLKKMTFFIIFTFLFCWSPYYMTKLAVTVTMPREVLTATENQTVISRLESNMWKGQCPPNWLFTWTLAIAALSCILNPILYMFSREKIRKEFIKTFLSSCSRDSTTSFTKDLQCIACWDTDENVKKSKTPGSIFSTGWHNKSKDHISPDITTQDEKKSSIMQTNANRDQQVRDLINTENKSTGASVNDRATVPRWNIVKCESREEDLDDSMEEEEMQQDSCLPDELMLPTINNNRSGSFSARSVDLMSCSTTTASFMGEL